MTQMVKIALIDTRVRAPKGSPSEPCVSGRSAYGQYTAGW
jgi:hypothetical protein